MFYYPLLIRIKDQGSLERSQSSVRSQLVQSRQIQTHLLPSAPAVSDAPWFYQVRNG